MKTAITTFNKRLSHLLVVALTVTSISATAGETVRYVHTDHLGTPIVWTDQNGDVIKTAEYEPYGLQVSGPVEDGPGYTGHVEDAATGLTYMQQRYYDPQIGMFLSVDPVTAYGNPVGQFNRYRYANGNPYRYMDPDGRSVWTKAIKLVVNGGDMAATFAGVVEDANTVMDSSASTTDRVIAGASLASELLPVSARDVGDAAGFVKDLVKKSCCFVAGTQVLTRDGYKNIEDVELGEELWAKNVETGEQAWKPVTKVFVEPGREIYEIRLVGEDGFEQKIEATDDHPFWVIGKGWKTTIELQPGDRVETDGNGAMMVQSVIDENRQDVTYNFTVAGFHTYYVTERNVLVHNCPSGKSRSSRSDPLPEAEGRSHTVVERSGPDGQYTTHNGDGTFKQYRGSGQDHGGIPRPNVKENSLNTNPETGESYPGRSTVRPATAEEIPRGSQ